MTVNYVQTSNIRNLGGKGVNDGLRLGDGASSKVGFFGATPIAQPLLTIVGTATATTTLNETRLGRIEALLENLGLCRTTS